MTPDPDANARSMSLDLGTAFSALLLPFDERREVGRLAFRLCRDLGEFLER